MKKLVTAGVGIFVIIIITCVLCFTNDKVEAGNDSEEYEYEYYYNDDNNGDSMDNMIVTDENITDTSNVTDTTDKKDKPKKIELDTTSDSITVFVNKEHALPSSYIPQNLIIPDIHFFGNDGISEKRYMRKEASEALEEMFSEATKDCLTLYGVSGYRSYKRQSEIYNKNIRQRGLSATSKVSAMPGHSEHQTGLAIDISCAELNGNLSTAFANTPEGQWIAANCHLYGFIIRYPENSEDITGYTYEPWHIRYVGTEVAKYIYENDITLEEYFDYTLPENYLNQITSDAATAENIESDESDKVQKPDKKEKDDKKKKDKNKQDTDDEENETENSVTTEDNSDNETASDTSPTDTPQTSEPVVQTPAPTTVPTNEPTAAPTQAPQSEFSEPVTNLPGTTPDQTPDVSATAVPEGFEY